MGGWHIGGVAVVLYGHVRSDIDICLPTRDRMIGTHSSWLDSRAMLVACEGGEMVGTRRKEVGLAIALTMSASYLANAVHSFSHWTHSFKA